MVGIAQVSSASSSSKRCHNHCIFSRSLPRWPGSVKGDRLCSLAFQICSLHAAKFSCGPSVANRGQVSHIHTPTTPFVNMNSAAASLQSIRLAVMQQILSLHAVSVVLQGPFPSLLKPSNRSSGSHRGDRSDRNEKQSLLRHFSMQQILLRSHIVSVCRRGQQTHGRMPDSLSQVHSRAY